MSTRTIMLARIRLDLGNVPTSVFTDAQISDEITTSIHSHWHERLHFNEQQQTASTVNAQDYIVVPTRLLEIDTVRLTVSGDMILLDPMTWGEYVRDYPEPSNTIGPPSSYVYRSAIQAVGTAPEERLYLAPRPNAVYTVTIDGLFEIPVPATDAEAANAWMAEPLVEVMIRKYTETTLFGLMLAWQGKTNAQSDYQRAHDKLTDASRKRLQVAPYVQASPLWGVYS